MSQPSSSIVSADNTQIKYRKALKEISKLMAANRALRQNSDKGSHGLKDKIDELSLRYEDLQKEYQACRKEKQSLSHYLDQLQKQRNTLDRQVAYLNEVLSEQAATLRKYQLQSDEKAMANLIRSYQNKEAIMNRNISQQEQIITRLKNHIQKQQSQVSLLQEEKRNIEDKFNRSSMEISRYRELNQSLMNQNQRILMEHSYKEEGLNQKQKQIQILANQFRSQINLLKTSSLAENNFSSDVKVNQNIQQLLSQKNRLSVQYAKLRQVYNQALQRQKYYFQVQEKLKIANTKAERAIEEANMLKSKIIVLEARQFLDEAGQQDYEHKQFEQRLAMMIDQNDPLSAIKNGDDSSHFRIMKSFLVDLQDKIYKINLQKVHTIKKYKSVKSKFLKYARQAAHYQQQNKLLKGKVEGYQRLTEKLHFQLQKSLANHDDEVTRMTMTSNNILNKKTDEYKNTIGFLNSQIEVSQEKLEKMEKYYKQQNETLKLELETLRIKYGETSEKANKQKQFLEIFKKKNQQINSRIDRLEEEVAEAKENSQRWQRLFRQEKTKGEGLITQKQQLIARNRQLVQQLDKKTQNYNQTIKNKENYCDSQIRRLNAQISRLKDDLQYSTRQLQKVERDLDERRAFEQNQVEQIKRISTRNSELQQKNNEYKKRIRDLEDQNETLKLKSKKYQQNYEKGTKFEEDAIVLNDKVHDLSRQKLSLQSELKILQNQCDQERKQNEQLKKQISDAKLRSMDASHEIRKELDNKILESKKIVQSLNQQISDLTAELREQKSKNMRYSNEINSLKSEKSRIQDSIDQNKKKDFQVQNQLGNLKLQISQQQMQNERLQNELKNQNYNINNMNLELQNSQQKIFSLNQQISSLKMKIETSEDEKNDLTRDLNSLKFNFNAVQTYISKSKMQANLKWEQQSFYSSCQDVFNKIRKIGRLYGVTYETVSINPIASVQTAKNTATKQITGDSAYEFYKSYSKGESNFNASDSNYNFKDPLEYSGTYNYNRIENDNINSSIASGNSVTKRIDILDNPAYGSNMPGDYQISGEYTRKYKYQESQPI